MGGDLKSCSLLISIDFCILSKVTNGSTGEIIFATNYGG